MKNRREREKKYFQIQRKGNMKRSKSVFLILFSIFLLPITSYAQQQEPQPVEFRPISESLYEVLGGRGAQGGAYIGDVGVLLIDAKMDKQSVDQTMDQLKKLTDKPILYLVNTHSDGDHIWGNQFFAESITFVAHENCREDLFLPKNNNEPSDWYNPELAPFVPSLTFRDKMDIFLGSKKVELWYFGVGHTTGDIVVYFPDEKTAFIGDQIFLTRPQLIHSYKGGNSFEHVKTLSTMLETLDAEKFCSGHSEMIGREEIMAHIEQMKERQEKVQALVDKGNTLEEIKAEFEEDEGRLVESIFNEIKTN